MDKNKDTSLWKKIPASVKTSGRIIITVILFYLILKNIDVNVVLATIIKANIWGLVGVFFIFILFFLLLIIRWQILLYAQGIKYPLLYIVNSFMIAYFFNNLLPTTIGGDVFRVMYTRNRANVSKATSTVIVDRMGGFLALFSVLLAASIMYALVEKRYMYLYIGLGGVVISLLFFFIFLNKSVYRKFLPLIMKVPYIGEKLGTLYDSLHLFRKRKFSLFFSFLFSFMIQLLLPILWFCIMLTVAGHSNVTVFFFFLVIPLVNSIAMLPISIGGMGLREGSIIAFLTGAGIGKEVALAISLLFLLYNTFFSLIGGLIFLIRRHS